MEYQRDQWQDFHYTVEGSLIEFWRSRDYEAVRRGKAIEFKWNQLAFQLGMLGGKAGKKFITWWLMAKTNNSN